MKLQNGIVTLITDFGDTDPYVAEMKGVILTENPSVRFVDVTHQVPPQDILYASFVLWRSYKYFPKGTIHLAIVDPGVGTQRSLLVAKTKEYFFLAPDNGLLGPIVQDEPRISLYAIHAERFLKAQPSPTFHGRDILAPCAAFLSRGISPQRFGESISSITGLPQWQPSFGEQSVKGHIISKDHFGNLVTNIHDRDYQQFQQKGKGRKIWIKVGARMITKLSRTYAEGGGALIALFGSSGLLELALCNGDASKLLAVRRGDPVLLIYESNKKKFSR